MVGKVVKSKSRKIVENSGFVNKNGLKIDKVYCRKCMETKTPTHFYQSTDLFLDGNMLLSICKECLSEIYINFYQSEKSLDRVILRMCRMLNIKFSEEAINATKIQLKTQNKDDGDGTVFGIYKAKVVSTSKENVHATADGLDLTFYEPIIVNNGYIIEENEVNDIEYYYDKWGKGFQIDDYNFLETEFSEWRKTHKCDNRAEETLLKEICYKKLEIQKARIENKPTTALVKDLQEIMKTANVDPAKATLASGKSQDTFSSFIKIIEENEPADYYKDKNLFKDFDNIDFYFKKYVTRPLKNFITQSRDFNVEKEDNDIEDFDTNENVINDVIEMGEELSNFDKEG